MEKFYCGDIVEPGSHLSLEDAVHYFNIFNGDVDQNNLTDVQKGLLNIKKENSFTKPDKDNLNTLYEMIAGSNDPVFCDSGPPECCSNKVQIQTYGWDDQTFRESVNGVSVKGFAEDGMFCIDMRGTENDGKGYPYGFLVKDKDGGNFFGKIMAGTNLNDKTVIFLTKSGDQYLGKITSASGNFDNELEFVGECALTGFTTEQVSEDPVEQNESVEVSS